MWRYIDYLLLNDSLHGLSNHSTERDLLSILGREVLFIMRDS